MKLAPLLAEFFYTHKRLDLPGIGSFLLEAGSEPDRESVKTGKTPMIEGASFESNSGIRESPELVSFISSSTGKIKALAAADLDSHLELARQFLNIGKPFLFEGIGSLTKLQTGSYSFAPGTPIPERASGSIPKESVENTRSEETGGFKSIFYAPKVKTDKRKTIFFILLIAGLVFAIWGGYTVYKKTTSKRTEPAVKEGNNTEPPVQPSTSTAEKTTQVRKDTTTHDIVSNNTAPGSYKFVVETADKTRGLTRYYRLKGFGLDIKMETADSVSFKLYFILPASINDTTRMLDSLRNLYTPPGSRAFVEK